MHSKDTPTRRQFLGSTLGLFGVAVVGGSVASSSGRVLGLGGAVVGPAAVFDPAERLGVTTTTSTEPAPDPTVASTTPATTDLVTDMLTFPVDADDQYGSLVCLNNFGGRSTANGQCSHNGIDIGNDRISGTGRPLLACVDGFVHKDEAFSSAGNTRILRDGLNTYYRYHHLDSYESSLKEGDRVVAGQVIGYMGNTGNTAWSHLHFEIWIGSMTPRFATIIDPVPRLQFPTANVRLRSSTACSS